MVKTAEIICEYQPYIDRLPVARETLYGQASSNDKATVTSWKSTWVKNVAANHAAHGPFKDRGLGKLFGKHKYLPAIVVGSGPSLKDNAKGLVGVQGIPIISCLHNFHFLEDLGVKVDYYVTLDAGPVTIEEVAEGGSKSSDDYWAMTKGKTLIAYIGTDPGLLAKWQGEVYFFNAPIPDEEVSKSVDDLEVFRTYVSSGGNVFGASLYIAKAFLGCSTVALMGANFSFSYMDKFHGWDSKYDANVGAYIRMTDVYGHTVKSWQSYANFKSWFDWVAETVPGVWVNCTEGGTWGAYPDGNLRSIRQMDLADFLRMLNISEELREQCEHPESAVRKILF